MTRNEVEQAMNAKYGQSLVEFRLSKGFHRNLKESDSGRMVWYRTDGGIIGRQWLETIEQWAAGNTGFTFDPDTMGGC